MSEVPKHAFHGGAFFGAIGESLRTLERASSVVSADVLDAWYDPSPKVISAISAHLPFLVKTSPPTHGEGLREVIATERGVPIAQVLPGAGTSSLMFMAFPRLIGPNDNVLVLDPSYGEYAHLVQNVVGARDLSRFVLPEKLGFAADIEELAHAARQVRLAVIVNPNSPTGTLIGSEGLCRVIECCPETTFWVDETYIDFPSYCDGQSQSLEWFVSRYPNLVVAKSMSKFYSLSGLRVGYLVASEARISEWERVSPPWSVGLIGQLAAIEALLDKDYYQRRALETQELAAELSAGLSDLGYEPVPTKANFVLVKKPDGGVANLVGKLAEQELFIRDANNLSPRFEDHWLRIAVKAREEQSRLLSAMAVIR